MLNTFIRDFGNSFILSGQVLHGVQMIPAFSIDEKVRAYIRKNEQDFRLSTSPEGPVLIPLGNTSPKPSDLKILIGSNVLYVSKLQARYIKKIDWPMVERFLNSSGESDS
jgi:hypothetical protein